MNEGLLDLLTRHVDCSVVCDRFCSCGVQHPAGHAAHLAEVIATEFLVVPRSEVVRSEYGYRYSDPGQQARTWELPSNALREDAIREADELRNMQTHRGLPVNAEALERPVLPWIPISPEVTE